MRDRRAFMAGLAAAAAAAGGAAAKDRGSTSASGTASANYATSGTAGEMSLRDIAALPRSVPPFDIQLKGANAKFFKDRTRVALATYGVALVRSGQASAYAGGFGSSMTARRSTIMTGLVGVSDALGGQIAEEAYADLGRRLTEAGYELVANADVQASAVSQVGALPSPTKGVNGCSVYGPAAAPLRAGTFFTSALGGLGAFAPMGRAAEALNAIILTPSLGLDYEWLQSSGSHTYGSSARVGAQLRFHALQNSGTQFVLTPPPPYKGGWQGSFLMPQGSGTDEPFAVLDEVDDRSDNAALSAAFALAGLGNMYRQKKIYAVEVAPERYLALARAAYQGLNAAIVAELVKARG
ncbi:MAG TPA: hypothetical protein VG939_13920 [Caulobacteraceae bacterium]|nr:hypothetical protein [Caulobacteraceae bacterium]